MPKPPSIRVIAICVFRVEERILVFEAFDSVKGSPFYRPLGGGVDPGETTRAAVAREIREELGHEITDLVLLGVIENLFTVEQRVGHEIVFVYDGRFVDETVYAQEYLTVVEDNGDVLRARWREISSFDAYHRLVPPELFGLLGRG
ncbi:MAG: NUDIX domain-containing protein [Caldilineaceae bacterium]